MLQHEFEKLAGMKVTEDQYEVINDMYLSGDTQTKQEFCKSFMEMGLITHVNYVVSLKDAITELRKDNFKMNSQRDMWHNYFSEAMNRVAVIERAFKMMADVLNGSNTLNTEE